MSIQLVTYANQTVTPTNDAIIYEKAVDQNGIFYGCNVTVTSNNVNITGGYGIVCGREFVINSESIAVTLAPSGTLDGRLYVRLDLADADAPIQLLTATGNTLPPLVQDDDVNYTNGTYEMELATFTVGVSSLSDVVETFEEIKGTKEGYMNLDFTASTGTVDGDLYKAITDVGWTDAVENELLNAKKMLTDFLTPIVTTYTATSLSHLVSASATLTRIGNIGLLYIGAKNTNSNLAVGSEASFKLVDFPDIAAVSRGVGYSGSTCMVGGMTINSQGVVTMRAHGAQWVSSYDVAIVIPLIFA